MQRVRRCDLPALRRAHRAPRRVSRLRAGEGPLRVMARAIWKGRLVIGEETLAIKLYSAVEDRKVHFRLLHAVDREPVEQRIVRKSDGKEVPKEDRRKAFPLDRDTAVVLQPDDLEELEPPASRDVHFCRFVQASAIGDRWFDRPYFVGPDDDDEGYFALAEVMAKKKLVGVGRWVMRKKPYLGALTVSDGYLTMITLRRADQVISVAGTETPASRRPDAKELKLAEQLVHSIADDFDPGRWEDEYRSRVEKLIEAKSRGEALEVPKPRKKRAGRGLAEQLRESLSAAKERKVA